ncbi:MAG: NFACT family protein, partial [Oscillospiraceae bacterium]|nr:NFACT family protein [Oscillospiraceae bacterium]
MGKTCNLYLLDKTGRIIDWLRRIGLDAGAKRTALPGMYYQDPEPVEKCHPLQADFAALLTHPGADI